MKSENSVIFKGTKDGITVLLDPDVDFDYLKRQLTKKVGEASKFFDGVKTAIAFKGRELTDKEENELIYIISEITNMNIIFVKTQSLESAHQLTLLSQEIQQHNLTKFHRGSIRSGQFLEYAGSVVVIGDINPGGVVKAEGNVIVLGQLKGTAHAGCTGMPEAFIAAVNMMPVQLRIGDIITRFPAVDKKLPKPPEFAYVENGQIYVMALV